jgi:hypothetical protein
MDRLESDAGMRSALALDDGSNDQECSAHKSESCLYPAHELTSLIDFIGERPRNVFTPNHLKLSLDHCECHFTEVVCYDTAGLAAVASSIPEWRSEHFHTLTYQRYRRNYDEHCLNEAFSLPTGVFCSGPRMRRAA